MDDSSTRLRTKRDGRDEEVKPGEAAGEHAGIRTVDFFSSFLLCGRRPPSIAVSDSWEEAGGRQPKRKGAARVCLMCASATAVTVSGTTF